MIHNPPLVVWIFSAIVLALLGLALFGYLTGAWDNDVTMGALR